MDQIIHRPRETHASPAASAAALPTRPLGRTGMAITCVGFGAWAIGGADWAVGWGAQNDNNSIRAIRRALERGINWIDTAAIYGLGHSEEIVRRALAAAPHGERPYNFAKCGNIAKIDGANATPSDARRMQQ